MNQDTYTTIRQALQDEHTKCLQKISDLSDCIRDLNRQYTSNLDPKEQARFDELLRIKWNDLEHQEGIAVGLYTAKRLIYAIMREVEKDAQR